MDTETLVGFVDVIWVGRQNAWIQDLMVASVARRNGVGSQFVEASREAAKAAGCDYLRVDFAPHLQSFHIETGGFAAIGTIHPMPITLIASVARNGVIGRAGDLAWRNPDDLRRVKGMTLGHTLLMGRRTFDSIGHPLPGRRTIVVTRQADWTATGVTVAHSVDAAIAAAGSAGEVFIFGGGDVYRQTIGRADRLEITRIDQTLEGDVYFPQIDPAMWLERRSQTMAGFSWITHERRGVAS